MNKNTDQINSQNPQRGHVFAGECVVIKSKKPKTVRSILKSWHKKAIQRQ